MRRVCTDTKLEGAKKYRKQAISNVYNFFFLNFK